MEILLNSLKNIESVNVDNYDKVELSNKLGLIHEYDVRNVLSATELFDAEREAYENYRIYGKIEYMSMLNGLKSTYSGFTDFFRPQTTNCKTVLNSFDFYLVRPATSGYTRTSGSTMPVYTPTGYTHVTGGTTDYIRYFQVIATPSQFEIYPVGFANNIYGEQAYAFNFNVDFDVSSYLDGFRFPLTELFLYAQYKPRTSIPVENVYGTIWIPETDSATTFSFTPKTLNIGDYVESFFGVKIGDVIGYSKSQFYQVQQHPQTFYITTPYREYHSSGGYYTNERLKWKYNPLIPFQLRYFSNEITKANTGNTAYEIQSSIPYYATKLDDMGNYVWRTIMPQGYIDPLSGLGVDYPFVNHRRYLFSNIILDITPDLNDAKTRTAFEQAWYSRNPIVKNILPTGDLNDIGKPCL